MNNHYLLALVFIIFATFSFSAVYQVNLTAGCRADSLQNFTTIQTAINNASNGDTVYVCYDGGQVHNDTREIKVNRSVNIYGNQSGVIVNITNMSGGPYGIFNITSHYVNVSNFSFVGGSGVPTAFAGIFSNASNLRIFNNVFNHSYHGIYLNGTASNNSIFNNIAYNNSGIGFLLRSSYGNNLTNNTAYNNSEHGFRLDRSSSTSTPPDNNTLSNNTAYNNSQNGFLVQSGNNVIFRNNIAYNNTDYGIE